MAAPALRGGQQSSATGTLSGTARTPAGEPVGNHGVQARNLETNEVAATSTTNGAGGFSFTGLKPANYVVELVDSSGKIAGISAATSVTAGGTATVGVSATSMAGAAGAGAAGAGVAGTGAAGTGATGAGAAGAGAAGAGAAAGSAGLFSTALIVTTVAVAAGVAGVVVVAKDNASPSR